MFTLTVIFNVPKNSVLMCWHSKQQAYNFIGGKVNTNEDKMDASYRELEEETGITMEDVTLLPVRIENVMSFACGEEPYTWDMFVTAGVLKHAVPLKEEKNPLRWIPLKQFVELLPNMFGMGNCYNFCSEAMIVCGVNG